MKLYIVYWVTLLVFVGLGCFLKPGVYPGSLWNIVQNVTALRTSYYGEAWFLFPYVMLSVTSGAVFRMLDRWGARTVYPLAFVLNYVAMFLISRYYTAFFDSHYAVYYVVLYFDCLLPFLTGALFCKYADRDVKWRWAIFLEKHQIVVVALMALLFLTNCFVHSAALAPVYLPLFVFLFIHVKWGNAVAVCLRFLGKFSTVVWLVHTWFCYYLFRDFIYGFYYPLLILAVELALSVAAGYVVMKVSGAISKKVLG